MKRLFVAAVLLLSTAAFADVHECELVGRAFGAFEGRVNYKLLAEVRGPVELVNATITNWIVEWQPANAVPIDFVMFEDDMVLVGRAVAMPNNRGQYRFTFKAKSGTIGCYFEGVPPVTAPITYG